MSKKLFTEEQILILRKSPYVEKVSEKYLLLTEAFKDTAYAELISGKSMDQIFLAHGLSPEILGTVRIMKFRQMLTEREKKTQRLCLSNGKTDELEQLAKTLDRMERELNQTRKIIASLKSKQDEYAVHLQARD